MAAASHNEAILHHRQNPNIIKTKATLAHKYLSVSIPYHQSSSRLSQQRSNVFTNDLTSHRPSIIIGPNPPYNAMPQSPARTRKCEVACDGRSDEMHLEQAIQNCNNGGHIVLAASQSCIMSREMRLENLQNIDIELQGNISFKCNPNGHAPLMSLQGVDVNLYGNGTIDGGGPQYWKKGKNSVRPNLLEISLDGGSVIGLHLADPPMMFVILRTSRNVLVSNLYLEAKARGTLQAYNSDGIDPSDSTNIVIQNSVIENDDDCVAIKAGSSFIVVQGLRCINSHGISIGSLGQRPLDTVEHVKVTNCEFEGGLAAARIKTLSGNNDGLISDVQYANIHVHNVVNAIEVNQCYETLKTCHSNPVSRCLHCIHHLIPKTVWYQDT